jgi:mannose-6-phosphate isomerase-like protein (cupin superfamily)
MELHRLSVQRDPGLAYLEFLRTQNLSAGVYRLPAGGVDSQQPHTEEEIYFVVSGRARFRAGEQDVEVSGGDFLFLEPGEPHHFHDIGEDLTLLVVFAPAESTSKAAREVRRDVLIGDSEPGS